MVLSQLELGVDHVDSFTEMAVNVHFFHVCLCFLSRVPAVVPP